MFRSTTVRIVIAVVACLALIAYLRFRPKTVPHTEAIQWKGPEMAGQRQTLEVAFIPVTCHLTCPVTDYATRTSSSGTRFDAIRFTEFPSIVDSLKAKKLLAGFLTVPLAIKMREQGAPVKICCLGHRDGSQLVIRKENPAKSLKEMRGKIIAIPSPLSNENFFIHDLLRMQGMQPTDIDFMVLPPPDMPAALSAKQIDGFIVAEPFPGKAEMDGYGRVLYYAKDIWPNYISCCLVVHEDLIKEKPEVVKDLVRGINESGEWTEQHRLDAAKLTAPYFRQNIKLMNYILTQPPDRVTYRNLNPTDAELQKIMDMGFSMGFFKKKTPISELLDRSYIPEHVEPAKIDMSKLGQVEKELGAGK